MENLLLNVLLLSNTSIIILVCVLWYVIGLVLILWTKYLGDGMISVLDMILALTGAILGILVVPLYFMIKSEMFDDIIIYRKK